MTQNDSSPKSEGYRSGTAARLTGVPVETLRVWERRYKVVGPRVSPRGQRLYSNEDIQRLTLIKQLVDGGYPIGSIAHLPTASLQSMRSAPEKPTKTYHVGIAGAFVASPNVIEALKHSALRVTCHTMIPAEAATLFKDAHIEAVIVELPTLTDDTPNVVSRIQQACDASQAIVLYRFAPGKVVRRLRQNGIKVARATSDPHEVAALCQTLLHSNSQPSPVISSNLNSNDVPPAPRFNAETLSQFLAASNNPYCECPRHLIELILSLNSFEQYSAECVNRSPQDAALHRDLQRTAGQARSLLENALDRLADVEGWRRESAAA
ncbi:MerR family transcriptional regulator [Neopusillimonas maritima]|uniref:HTH merR-type domain-containing protein n=1 Tax=Neopusillimonas maritima TaxID=2026239 RepID=A0A3A1YWU7_9BURK|nr:MerR family transcriptional regulator [Neopusillimonas maritima]RIY41310.1 hypothetical protein CJP73_07210 [Neopusillimonas maritima]